MATPFVADTAAVLLEDDPPDRIEDIHVATASPMDFPNHVAGACIDVHPAVDIASNRLGRRLGHRLLARRPRRDRSGVRATLSNPEVLEFAVTGAGMYKYLVNGHATVLADCTLDSTVTRATTSVAR